MKSLRHAQGNAFTVGISVPIRVAIVAATLAPLISNIAACSAKNPYPEPKSPVAQTAEVLGKDFCPERRYSQQAELCTSGCGQDDPFHYGYKSVVVDCSPKEGIYHKFAFTENGALIWEGFGDESVRMFVKTDPNGNLIARTSIRRGSGWIPAEFHTEGVDQVWNGFVKSIR